MARQILSRSLSEMLHAQPRQKSLLKPENPQKFSKYTELSYRCFICFSNLDCGSKGVRASKMAGTELSHCPIQTSKLQKISTRAIQISSDACPCQEHFILLAMSLIKPILQMASTICAIHCKYSSLKALVIPEFLSVFLLTSSLSRAHLGT